MYPEPIVPEQTTQNLVQMPTNGYRFIAPQVEREERLEGPHRLTAPESQIIELLPEVPGGIGNIGNWEAPDPIRQGQFWAEGDKVRPDAHQWIASHTAIPYQERIDEQTFQIGKIIGYWHRPMHAGGQLPSVLRANIQEAVPTTYGGLYEVSPVVNQPGPAFSPYGFEEGSFDGYPY